MRRLTASLLSLVLTAAPVWAEPVPLDVLSRYMTDLQTVEAPFTQLNGDGSTSTGLFQLRRPGKMRFEYDPPDQAMVVAGGNVVVVVDKRLETAKQYPLRRTPLKLILARKVDLTGTDTVIGHYEENGLTVVVAHDPKNPENGQIDLIFTQEPLALRQWRVRDESGGQTVVLLDPFDHDATLPLSLFNVVDLMETYGDN